MDGTATISLDTLDELREKAEEARLATNRSKRFTSKLMDCYEFDTEKYNKALEEIDEKENLTDKQCSKLIREALHCTTAQVNNARTSGDHIFGEYKVEEIDRKLSRKTDFDLLREFESVCDQLLGSRKGKK